jgi:hypothetical protein
MTKHWALACHTCLQGVRLGKLVEVDDTGLPIEPYFQGFRDLKDGTWVGEEDLLRLMQRFLISHLGHAMGLVDGDAISDHFEMLGVAIDEEAFRYPPLSDIESIYLSDLTGISTQELVQRIDSRLADQ